MKVLDTATLRPGLLSAHEALQVYNGREAVPIQLTQDYVAWVAPEDAERITAMRWFASVGIQIRAARMSHRRMIYMQHQVLDVMPWELSAEGLEIDHINRDTLDNHKDNLRIVTHTENMRNTLRHKERKGYAFNYRANLYSCYLDMPGEARVYLGYTKTEEEAIARVAEARRRREVDTNSNA